MKLLNLIALVGCMSTSDALHIRTFNGTTSEERYMKVYKKYDQLALDFKKCQILGEALLDTAPT